MIESQDTHGAPFGFHAVQFADVLHFFRTDLLGKIGVFIHQFDEFGPVDGIELACRYDFRELGVASKELAHISCFAVLDRDAGPVGGIDVTNSQANHEQHDADLDYNQSGVRGGAFLDPHDQQGSAGSHNCYRQHVEAVEGPVFGVRGHERPGIGRPVRGNRPMSEADDFKKFFEILRPVSGNHRATHRVFEYQIPADDPRHQLAECGISVGVGAAGNRRHGSKLRITESC